jgi:hypothetical protein
MSAPYLESRQACRHESPANSTAVENVARRPLLFAASVNNRGSRLPFLGRESLFATVQTRAIRKEVSAMGSSALHDATRSIIEWGRSAGKQATTWPQATEIFGSLTFSDQVQRRRLPRDVYKALQLTITQGASLDPAAADVIASAMKDWAMPVSCDPEQ